MKLTKLTPLSLAGTPGSRGGDAPSGAAPSADLLPFTPDPQGSPSGRNGRPRLLVHDATPFAGAEHEPQRLTRAERDSLVGGGPESLGLARHAYWIAGAAAALWAAGLVAFELAFEGGVGAIDYTPFRVVVFAGLALMPAGFILLGATAARQAARLAAETRRARALAGELVAPAALAALQTGGVLQTMRDEIERATTLADTARSQLAGLRDGLSDETERLAATAAAAERGAQGLFASLAHEREALGDMAAALDAQAEAAHDAFGRQALAVGEGAHRAHAQVQEAGAVLAARSADLTAAAADVAHAALGARQTLAGETDRLERAGAFLGERYRGVEAGLSDRHAALEQLADSLRADQSEMDAQLDRRREAIGAVAAESRDRLDAVSDAALSAATHIRELADLAGDRTRSVGQIARDEQTSLEALAREGLAVLSGRASAERAAMDAEARTALTSLAEAAEQARLAIAEHAEAAERGAEARAAAARAEIERLNEAAFAAGQRADQTFEARLGAARKLIDQSAALVDEAGARSAARIESGLAASKDALSGLSALLSELDGRVERLPSEVQSHADALRSAVAQGVGELTAAARKAAEDTQAIDAAFQARIRRNYEMLSEAVQLMGKIAGGEAARKAAPTPFEGRIVEPTVVRTVGAPGPAAAAPVRVAAGGGEYATRSAAPAQAATPALRPAALSEPARAAEPTPGASLRPRLNPPAVDDPALAALFESGSAPAHVPAKAAPPARADDWTWKDLLASLEEAPIDDDALADRLIGEIEGMGVDSAALLPEPLIAEVVRAGPDRGGSAAREAIRRAAPAAVRRLGRRLSTDKIMRAHAERFVRRFEPQLADATRRDPEGFMAAALLASEAGRAGLLLDAALRDLP